MSDFAGMICTAGPHKQLLCLFFKVKILSLHFRGCGAGPPVFGALRDAPAKHSWRYVGEIKRQNRCPNGESAQTGVCDSSQMTQGQRLCARACVGEGALCSHGQCVVYHAASTVSSVPDHAAAPPLIGQLLCTPLCSIGPSVARACAPPPAFDEWKETKLIWISDFCHLSNFVSRARGLNSDDPLTLTIMSHFDLKP